MWITLMCKHDLAPNPNLETHWTLLTLKLVHKILTQLVHVLWICRSHPQISQWAVTSSISASDNMWLTSMMPGQWRWPTWCHAEITPHSHVCWEWSGPRGTKEKIEQRCQNCEHETHHVTIRVKCTVFSVLGREVSIANDKGLALILNIKD